MPRLDAGAMTALVFLFFAQAQRALFGSVGALTLGSDGQGAEATVLVAVVVIATILLAPLLPATRWADRRTAVVLAVAASAAFRLPMTHPALPARLYGAVAVVAATAGFLVWAVGLLDRRALAAGMLTGLAADQLLLVAGASFDLSLRPGWLPVQAVLSVAVLAAAWSWHRRGRPPVVSEGGNDLERRAGALRLRAALVVGALLYLDLHILGSPVVLARWAGVPFGPAALLSAAATGAAVAVLLGWSGPVRRRTVVAGLLLALAAGLFVGWWGRGVAVAVVMAAGHAAALLLLVRALDPAGGRRSAAVVSAGFAVFIGLTALYGATFFAAEWELTVRVAGSFVMGVALALVAAATLLMPRPTQAAPLLRRGQALLAGLLPPAAAVIVVLTVLPPASTPTPSPPLDGTVQPAPAIRVAAMDARHGFDGQGRFDPERVSDLLSRADPDLAALRHVSAGLAFGYGIDMPLWIERRLGVPVFFAPAVQRMHGQAILSRLPTREVVSRPLASERGGPDRVVSLHAVLGGRSVLFHALDPGGAGEGAESGVAGVAGGLGSTRAVVLGRPHTAGVGPATAVLGAEGFAYALDPSMPAADDGVWVRGFRVGDAGVLRDAAGRTLVVVTLHIAGGGVR